MAKINWEAAIQEVKSSLANFFEPRGITPTLRTMFYRLYSLKMIPNTKSAYQQLIKQSVRARKEGLISFDSFADGAKRAVIGNYRESYEDPLDDAKSWVKYIKTMKEQSTYEIGKWYNQKHYVECWIEKDAMADTFRTFLADQGVYIAVNKGYSSWTFLYDNAKRLLEQQNKGKEIHVLYFGDFDPSGLDMEQGHLVDALSFFGLENIDLQRICITLDQIQQFNLPEIPEAGETVEKAKRDPRYQKFIAEHGRLILVELDAMLALAPDDFKTIVQASVDQYFDEDVYDEVQELEERNAEIKRKYLDEHLVIKEDSD